MRLSLESRPILGGSPGLPSIGHWCTAKMGLARSLLKIPQNSGAGRKKVKTYKIIVRYSPAEAGDSLLSWQRGPVGVHQAVCRVLWRPYKRGQLLDFRG